MQQPTTATARPVTDAETAFFREHGWACLGGLVPPPLVRRLRAEAGKLMGAGAERAKRSSGEHFRSLWRTLDEPSRDSGLLRSFATSPDLGRLGSRLLRDRPVRFLRDELIVKMPTGQGEGIRTPWHQDFPYASRDRSGQLTLWIALEDTPPERGTLCFLSGSHRMGLLGRALSEPDNDLVVQYPELSAECEQSPPLHLRAGDATVHHCLVVHGAPPNTTDRPRWAYTVVLFQADALYTGTPQRLTGALQGLRVNRPFDHPLTPVVWPL